MNKTLMRETTIQLSDNSIHTANKFVSSAFQQQQKNGERKKNCRKMSFVILIAFLLQYFLISLSLSFLFSFAFHTEKDLNDIYKFFKIKKKHSKQCLSKICDFSFAFETLFLKDIFSFFFFLNLEKDEEKKNIFRLSLFLCGLFFSFPISLKRTFKTFFFFAFVQKEIGTSWRERDATLSSLVEKQGEVKSAKSFQLYLRSQRWKK